MLKGMEAKPDAWNDLELPDGHREIVQSLIKSHFAKDKSKKVDFDLVRDKGHNSSKRFKAMAANYEICKGLIMLLHGAPGVGKTSTAGN